MLFYISETMFSKIKGEKERERLWESWFDMWYERNECKWYDKVSDHVHRHLSYRKLIKKSFACAMRQMDNDFIGELEYSSLIFYKLVAVIQLGCEKCYNMVFNDDVKQRKRRIRL